MASINRGDPAIRQAVSRYAELGLCGLLVLSAFNIPALAGPHGGAGGGGGHSGGGGASGAGSYGGWGGGYYPGPGLIYGDPDYCTPALVFARGYDSEYGE